MEETIDKAESSEEPLQVRSFHGLLPKTSICVDCFSPISGASIYFLTHFHSDHYTGLSSSWQDGIIYCTETTKLLIYQKFPLIKKSVVRSLLYGSWYIHMIDHATWLPSRVCPAEENPEFVQVSLFPSQHCPGACVFIFEGYFGKYVYTGDLRLELNDKIGTNPHFTVDLALSSEDVVIPWNKMRGATILFMDTTFANPLWEKLPTRIEAISKTIELIEQSPPTRLVLLECEMLGSEQVLVGVYEHFGQKIYAEKKLYEKLSAIPGMKHKLTTSRNSTRFMVVQHGTFTRGNFDRTRLTKDLTRSIHATKALHIKPSTQWFGSVSVQKNLDMRPTLHHGVWHILYSIHSSFSEIRSFVSKIKPCALLPLVSVTQDVMNCLTSLCGSSMISSVDIPLSISHMKGHLSWTNSGAIPHRSVATESSQLISTIPSSDLLDDESTNMSTHHSDFENARQGTPKKTMQLDPDVWECSPSHNLRSLFAEEEEEDAAVIEDSRVTKSIISTLVETKEEKDACLHSARLKFFRPAPNLFESIFDAVEAEYSPIALIPPSKKLKSVSASSSSSSSRPELNLS